MTASRPVAKRITEIKFMPANTSMPLLSDLKYEFAMYPKKAAASIKPNPDNQHFKSHACWRFRDSRSAFANGDPCVSPRNLPGGDSNGFCFASTGILARDRIKLYNARVNRADEKCKLVKMESDTMGGHDHPTTGQPQRCGRFGSTHCYPCSRCFRCSNSIGSTNRSRACLCMDRARQR